MDGQDGSDFPSTRGLGSFREFLGGREATNAESVWGLFVGRVGFQILCDDDEKVVLCGRIN